MTLFTTQSANQVTYPLNIIQTQNGPLCTNITVRIQSTARPPSAAGAVIPYFQMKQVFQILPDESSTGVVSLTISQCVMEISNTISDANGVVSNNSTFQGSGPWTFTYNQNALTNISDEYYFFTSDAYAPHCSITFIQRQFHPPVATGTTFTTSEGATIPINLGNPQYYFDADGDTLIAVTIPNGTNSNVGELIDYYNNPITSFPYKVYSPDSISFPINFRPSPTK